MEEVIIKIIAFWSLLVWISYAIYIFIKTVQWFLWRLTLKEISVPSKTMDKMLIDPEKEVRKFLFNKQWKSFRLEMDKRRLSVNKQFNSPTN